MLKKKTLLNKPKKRPQTPAKLGLNPAPAKPDLDPSSGSLTVLPRPAKSEALQTAEDRLQDIESDLDKARKADAFTAVSNMQRLARSVEKEIEIIKTQERMHRASPGLVTMTDADAEAALAEACDGMADWHLKFIANYWLDKHNLRAEPR